MNMLGLQYTLSCQVLNEYLLDTDPVLTYHDITFPTQPGYARRLEHVIFDEFVPMNSLHDRLFGKDKLEAEVRLINMETSAEDDVTRTDELLVALAACLPAPLTISSGEHMSALSQDAEWIPGAEPDQHRVDRPTNDRVHQEKHADGEVHDQPQAQAGSQ